MSTGMLSGPCASLGGAARFRFPGAVVTTTFGPAPHRSEDPRQNEDDAASGRDPVPTWEEVASRYGRKIYRIAYRLTGDPDDARDLTQDVFVRVYRNLDKYQPGTFDGWLYRITKNLFLDKVRKHRRMRLEPLPEEDWRQPEESSPGPQERLEAGQLRGDIEQALTQLPPDFRTAVVLCDIEGLTYDEIADVTGWPLGTVRSRIHRGRRRLRRTLLTGSPAHPAAGKRSTGSSPPSRRSEGSE